MVTVAMPVAMPSKISLPFHEHGHVNQDFFFPDMLKEIMSNFQSKVCTLVDCNTYLNKMLAVQIAKQIKKEPTCI